MAVATSAIRRDATSLKRVFATLTFSGTYSTGGEAPTNGFLKDLSLSEVYYMIPCGVLAGSATNGLVAKYNTSTNKVMLYRVDQVDDTFEEVPNTTALDQVGSFEFVGQGNS